MENIYDKIERFRNGFAIVKDDDLYGFIDSDGSPIGKMIYNHVRNFNNRFAAVQFENKWGFINENGIEICPLKYDYLSDFTSRFGRVCIGNKWGLINEEGQEICEVKYDDVFFSNIGFVVVRLENKYGILNEIGEEIIPLSSKLNFSFEELFFEKKSKLWVLKNKEGEEIMSLESGSLFPFNFKCWPAKSDLGWGIINDSGLELSEFKFDKSLPLDIEYSKVKSNDKWGIISKEGFEIVPVKYDDVELVDNFFFKAMIIRDLREYDEQIYKSWALIDKDGTPLTPFEYDYIEKFHNTETYCVGRDSNMGLIDKSGKVIIEPYYASISPFSFGFAVLRSPYWYVNKKGKKLKDLLKNIQPKRISYLEEFKFGFAVVGIGGYQNIIDLQGNVQFPFFFEKIYNFRDGFAEFSNQGFQCFANRKGNLSFINPKTLTSKLLQLLDNNTRLFPRKYDKIILHSEEYSVVTLKEKYGCIDNESKEILEVIYDEIKFISEGYATLRLGAHWGLLNSFGKLICEVKFDAQIEFTNEIAIVNFNGKKGIINKLGEYILKPIYKSISQHQNRLLIILNDGKFQILDETGKLISKEKYDYASIKDEYIVATKHRFTAILDLNGNNICEYKYDSIQGFHNGFAIVTINNKYGFIDQKGKQIGEIKYDLVGKSNFFNGFARVNVGYKTEESELVVLGYKPTYTIDEGKWGFLSNKGVEICELKYDELEDFDQGVAWVKLNNDWGVIDMNGKEIFAPEFASPTRFNQNGEAIVQVPLFSYLIDINGNRRKL